VPLILLVEVASRGDIEGTKAAAAMFLEHAQKLIEVGIGMLYKNFKTKKPCYDSNT
jgi:hypothetical protein